MKVSKETLILVVVQYLEFDGDNESDDKIIVLPCRNEETAKSFEDFYRKKFPPTQLQDISFANSSVYG